MRGPRPSLLARLRATPLVWLSLVLLTSAGVASCKQPAGTASEEQSVRPGANERFLADDLDVDRFVEIFEGESREISVHRDRIVEVLGLAEGTTIADIGSGTGLFLPAFNRAAGSSGRVYAVDLSPKFLVHLRNRADKEGLERVEVVTALEDSVELPAASVDVAFVCDTYHHFEYPQSTLASLRSAIRPGGSLVIVDFERIPGQSQDWILDHVRAGKQVFTQEIAAAGFELIEEVAINGLEENYVLRFRRP
jgi:ubiquinone/menaquinone biosynthesis C-methylase UbiE